MGRPLVKARPAASDVSEDTVERPRHSGQIQRVDERTRIPDLPAVAAEPAPELLFRAPSSPRRLLLQGAERLQVTLRLDDLLHGRGAEGTDQLVLQVCDAHVKPEPFHVGSNQVGAEPGPFETAPEVVFLSGVTQARQSEVEPLRAEPSQEASDRLGTADRHDGDAVSFEIPAPAHSQRFERDLVADPFDEHDRARMCGNVHCNHGGVEGIRCSRNECGDAGSRTGRDFAPWA